MTLPGRALVSEVASVVPSDEVEEDIEVPEETEEALENLFQSLQDKVCNHSHCIRHVE